MPGMPRAWFGYRPSRWSVVLPVVGALAGLLFATSFQIAQGTEIRSPARDLPSLVRAQSGEVAGKAQRAQQLQGEVDSLTALGTPGSQQLKGLTDQAGALAPGVGTAAVRGPFVSVSLDDAHRDPASLPKPYVPDDIVVHQQDVQAVVNALWAGGAEAMMIQDQRVIATSAVRCVGNTLILQGRVYSPPYVIKAIGDAGRLQGSLAADPQVRVYREWVDAVGLGYRVTASAEGTFPAYAGVVNMQLATASP